MTWTNYQRRYYIPYVLLQSKKGRGVKKGSEQSFAWELSGHQSAHGKWWLPLHHLFWFLSLLSAYRFSCFCCSFPLPLSTHSRGKWARGCVVLCCLLGLRPDVNSILWQGVPELNDESYLEVRVDKLTGGKDLTWCWICETISSLRIVWTNFWRPKGWGREEGEVNTSAFSLLYLHPVCFPLATLVLGQ